MQTNLIVLLILCISCNTQERMTDKSASGNWQKYYEVSGYETPETLIIKDAETWQKVQERIFTSFTPKPVLPKVNFAKENIALIAFGTFSYGGQSYKLKSFTEEDNMLKVTLTTPYRDPMSPVVTMMTQPVLIFAIPATQISELEYNITTVKDE